MGVDEQRYAELDRKRFTSGLTKEEADELGEMMAQREGKTHLTAEQVAAEEAIEEASSSGDEEKPANEDELEAWRRSRDNADRERETGA